MISTEDYLNSSPRPNFALQNLGGGFLLGPVCFIMMQGMGFKSRPESSFQEAHSLKTKKNWRSPLGGCFQGKEFVAVGDCRRDYIYSMSGSPASER